MQFNKDNDDDKNNNNDTWATMVALFYRSLFTKLQFVQIVYGKSWFDSDRTDKHEHALS